MTENTNDRTAWRLVERLGLVAIGTVIGVGLEAIGVHSAPPVHVKAPPVAVQPIPVVDPNQAAKDALAFCTERFENAYSAIVTGNYSGVQTTTSKTTPNQTAELVQALIVNANCIADHADVSTAGDLQTTVSTLALTKNLSVVTGSEKNILADEIGTFDRFRQADGHFVP